MSVPAPSHTTDPLTDLRRRLAMLLAKPPGPERDSALLALAAGEIDRPAGVLTAADRAGLSGLELLRRTVAGAVPVTEISVTLGFRLVAVEAGVATFEGDPAPHLQNRGGAMHGGLLLTVIDSACACAAISLQPPGRTCTTVSTTGTFSRPLTLATGRYRCEGRVLAAGSRIVSTEARVTGPDGKLLASGTSTLMVIELL